MLNIAAGNPITGYNLTRSLRFRSSASAYLNRTYVASPTDYRKYTFSTWVKLGALGVSRRLIDAGSGSDTGLLNINSDGTLEFTIVVSGSGTTYLKTNNVLRDPSAWYHIVFSCDTSVGSSQFKFYVNNVQTSYSTNTAITINYGTYLNSGSSVAQLGRSATYAQYFDGYMTEINFIDGQTLTPTSFGSYNSTTGVWQPAPYTGTYGANGFYLPFTDNSALTTSSNVGLGKDFSGNGNYWTTNNISITAGTTYDSMTDVPTLTSATAANFAVLNPLAAIAPMPSTTFANGNLQVTGNSPSSHSVVVASCAMPTGKWYAEFTLGTVGGPYPLVGIINQNTSPSSVTYLGSAATTYGYASDGNKYNSAAPAAYGASFTSNDVIGIAYDATTGSLSFYKNGASQGVAFSGLTGTYFIAVDAYNAGYWSANFGQRPFAYTPPTGYVALNTYNLPTSTILQGNTVMDATTYTGTGSTQSIINAAGFKPDFVWIKNRNNVRWHILTDSVRGTNSQLFSNDTAAQEARTDRLTAFNSNGFSVGSYTDVNLNADTFVGWQWQAGQGTTSSNTSGTITSTVSVNASAGFSVVTYTGTGANATVGHGLGVAPALVIVKARNQAYNWNVYSSSLASTQFLRLNTTDSVQAGPTLWNSTSPTSSVFSIGTSLGVNGSGDTHVAYCFAPIAGYSAFGSYTGNGSTDGTFVYTGFRPKFVLIKRTNTTSSWIIWDSVRGAYNLNNADLYPDLSIAEYASPTDCIDMLSNGFKLRATGAGSNGSGDTFIYACFAENPFKNALAR